MWRLPILATKITLNVAISTVLILWVLSLWTSVLGDIGSNSISPSGIGFMSSPKGLKLCLIDRAWITNGFEFIDINASRTGWDWDLMQSPFQRKWSCLGASVWYRTRQCLFMLAVTYPTAIISLSVAYALLSRVARRENGSVPGAAESGTA